jgi:amino acid adenylation domain-containing protein
MEQLRVETSFAQQSLWLVDQADPGQPTYNVLGAVRMRGELDVAALHRALNAVVARHEALRTTFVFDGYEPLQVIWPELTVPLPVTDVSADVEELIRTEIEQPFDLRHPPLIRMRLLRRSPTEHVAVLVMHHIVTDGWSSAILFQELSQCYEAYASGGEPSLAELPVQYADFAVWQRETLGGEALAELVDYWTDQLTGVTPLLLPTDRARPAQASAAGDVHAFHLPVPVVAELERVGREAGVTPFMLYLAAFEVLLGRYAGRDDLTVASPVIGRSRPETAGLIGFFVNTLILHADLSGDPTFVELLGRVKNTCLGAFAHADVPYEKLVDELRPQRYTGNGGPLAQVMFSLQNIPSAEWKAGGLVFEAMHVATRTAKFDLSLEITPADGEHRAVLEYSTELFARATVERLGELYTTLLASIVADPHRRVSTLALLSGDARQVLLDGGAAPPDVDCVHRLVARQAAATPDAVAVTCGGHEVSYAELERRVNRLAHRLRAAGMAERELVAVLLPRSVDLVVALLAVLTAGGAYLPLDAGYPAERLAFLLADSGVRHVLTTDALQELVTGDAVTAVLVGDDPGGPATPPADTSTVDDLAYVIYTSGSTGAPKGAMNTHRGLATLAAGLTATLGLDPTDRALQLAPIGFDVLAEEVYPYLLSGGSVALPDGAAPVPPDELWRLVAETGATTLSTTPSRLLSWTGADRAGIPGCLRRIIFGSEAAPTLAALLPWRDWPGELWQVYGVTEAACTSVARRVDFAADPELVVPLGRALAGCAVRVLDEWYEPVPPGVEGELCLTGPSVGRGYLGRPGLTAHRFVPDPYGAAGSRLYRTGDRVRRLGDGDLVFVGRGDQQVKIRGFRVEPGEIEAVLAGSDAVAACAVTARPDRQGQLRLIAYAVPRPGHELSGATLRRFAADRLPDWMVPGEYAVLDELPMSPNGKVDRAALVEPDRSADIAAYVAPRTPVEDELASIWAEVLDRSRVGIHDSFFLLGGNSLLAVQMLARVRDRLGVEVPMRALFTADPTVAEVGALVFEELLKDAGDLSALDG